MGQYSTYSNHGAAESVLETEGGTEKINVTNVTSEQLLDDILLELKKLNTYMSLMTDVVVQDLEVE